jgi:hypothetical protein
MSFFFRVRHRAAMKHLPFSGAPGIIQLIHRHERTGNPPGGRSGSTRPATDCKTDVRPGKAFAEPNATRACKKGKHGVRQTAYAFNESDGFSVVRQALLQDIGISPCSALLIRIPDEIYFPGGLVFVHEAADRRHPIRLALAMQRESDLDLRGMQMSQKVIQLILVSRHNGEPYSRFVDFPNHHFKDFTIKYLTETYGPSVRCSDAQNQLSDN